MALSSDGSVYTWGNNNSGELGRNLVTFSNSTGKITDGIIYNVTKAISCGTATTFLQGVNNVLYGCGDGGYLGNGVNGIVNPCLAIVSDELSGVEIISMATSNYDTIVLVDKGLAPSPTLPEVSYSLIGWGVNNFAKIHANFLQVFAPAAIDMGSIDMSNVVSIANGQNHMLVLLQNGEIYGRGYHLDGQLGDGKAPAIYDYVSINVQVDTTAFTAAGAHITAIAAGSSASLALDSVNNKLFVWGYEYEQGTQILSPQLVQVNSSSPLYGKTITKIFAGYYNSFITDSDGKIYGIGINDEDSSTPVQLLSPAVGAKSDFVAVQPSLSSISQVAVGKYHVLALDTNGKVYGWGLNDYGQIADHIMDNTVRTNPIEIVFEANATIIAISAGGTHSVALSSTGAIYTWGDNIGGQLGRGDSSLLSSNVPTLTGGEMGSIKYITTGEYVTIVVTQDNSIYGCGDGISIGNGDYNVHYTFEKIVSSALEGNTPLLVTTGGPDTIVYAVTSVSTTTVLPTTTVEPTTPEPTFSPTTMAPTTVEPTITPTIAPTSTAATTQTPTTLQSCNNFDTNRYGAKKPIVSASTNGSSVTIVVTMYRQTMSNTGTPIYHAIDTKDTPTVCRTNSDNIQLSSSKPWSRSDDGCTTTYTLTQSLSEIVATNNTNNNWVAKLADDGRSITYTIRVYSTYSVNNAGSCYYVGYQSTISMRTVLSVASSSVEYTTEDNSARFLFNGLRITATQRLEIAGIIVPLIFNSELRNIYMRKSFDNITIPATTATCNAVNTGCYEIFSIDVSSLGGAGTDISDEYRIIMDVFKDGDRIISNATISFYISYSIPGDPIVVDSDTITTSIKLYTDNTYSVVRTASYASADGVLFVENKVTLSSPVIPSSHRLRMAEGYLCCVNYLSNIAPYNPVTGTGGCKDANGKMEQFSFGSETNHNTGVTVVSADASSPKRYRVQVELSKAYASIVHSVPMTCEVLLISKLESNARSITAAANLGGSFVATIPFSVQATQATTTPTVTPTTATTTATPVSTQKVAETIPAPSKSDARMNSISALLTIMALVFACYEIFSCQ
jgi:alpha-tubulin suppressor-like RCC1 family protein